jgi:MFS family permease
LAVLLGGQAWFVTLTWLLIDRGAPGPTIGLVLMVAAIPRAALMLVGGAITDRHPPLAVLRISAGVMTVLIGLATFLVTQGAVPTWQLAALAALIGATDAFFFPAVGALIRPTRSSSCAIRSPRSQDRSWLASCLRGRARSPRLR